jgi:protease PrsW
MAAYSSKVSRPFVSHAWVWILISGIVLFFIIEKVMVVTHNINFLPTIIMLGAFLVPVAFVTYVYERHPDRDVIPVPPIALCFLWGGAIGVTIAGLLEYEIRRELGVLPLLGVGLVEEAAKLMVPVVIYWQGRYRSEFDGIVFGVASGMGFAALETMGYSLVSLIISQGDIGILQETLLVRGLFSPAAHAAWTGIVCAILWRERERAGGRNAINLAVISAFVLAVVLHTFWDTFQSLSGTTFLDFAAIELLSFIVALTSFGLLVYRIMESRRRSMRSGRVQE